MSRFDIDITEISDERILIPNGVYPARISKSEVRKGETDKGEWANLSLTLVISDPEVVKLTNHDEPSVFWSGMFAFDQTTGKFLKDNCPELGQFIKVTGFEKTEDFEEGTETAETERDYVLKLFENMGNAAIGTDLICNVGQEPHYQDKDRMVNRVSGIAAIEEKD